MRRPTLAAAPNHRHVPAVGQLLGRLSPVQVDPVGLRSQQTYLAKELSHWHSLCYKSVIGS